MNVCGIRSKHTIRFNEIKYSRVQYSTVQLGSCLLTTAVLFDDKNVLLTEKELQLILLLFNDTGNVVSRNIIWSSVWGIVSNQVSSRTIDTHIYRLRTKLELDGQHGYMLKTLHGKGYCLSVPGTETGVT